MTTPRDVIGLWLARVWMLRSTFPATSDWGNCADDLLKRLDEQGLAVVPKEPTKAMLDAGDIEASSHCVTEGSYDRGYGGSWEHEGTVEVWRAMLSAYSPERDKP